MSVEKRGTIKTIPITPLQNKLVIRYFWKTFDGYMEWDHYEKDYDILECDWKKIIEKGLIDKDANFEIMLEHEVEYDKIIWPTPKYSEKEVEVLICAAWTDGFYTGDTSGRHVSKRLPSEFWNENKKK
jgi:hypothetical protein